MICHEKQFIFIDICKTAGTSIIAALSDKYECIGKHHSITNITGRYKFCTMLTRHQIDNYFKFTIVRNPYDRLVSLWLWRVVKKYGEYTFPEFVEAVKNKVFQEYNYHRYIPQLDWITDVDGSVKVDYIGKYENLQNNFNTICRKIGIKPIGLHKVNTNIIDKKTNLIKKHYTEYYDEKSYKTATKLYEKDLEYFGYEF